MSTITKQAVQAVADLKAGYTLGHADVAILNELARIALASLEAEPAYFINRVKHSDAYGDDVELRTYCYELDALKSKDDFGGEIVPVYTAPPAPANAEPIAWMWSHRKHPSEVTLVRPEDDEKAEGAHWSGWSCQALYAAPPAPVSVPDYPDVLPCPVMLEPGLRFGKGVHTKTVLDALQRRDEYYADLETMTPEERAEHNAGMKELAAMLQDVEPVTTDYKLPEETGSSLQLRNLIRQRHAEWSQATFGDVGPVGPLKHLSKEALEAAEEPEDLSEWADMQFLLWDAQRRAGISDGEITAAMEEKLKVNMARQWPEPKDGEPRLHIKAAPQQEA